MRVPVALAALAGVFVLAAVLAGQAPALSQDFSITNPEEPGAAGRRDLMRQLQAWWDVHGYYPKHASNNDEGGTVKVHLVIYPDGRIWAVTVTDSSGSSSLDTAAVAAFRGGFVRPFPNGEPDVAVDLSLHYVLAYRHDQPVLAGTTPVSSNGAFTITNGPVKSPILETMLQRTCTGQVVKQGIRNHPWYGVHYWAEAVFFRKPDGTPWVEFYEGGYSTLAPVIQIGKMVQWTGRAEALGHGEYQYTEYTVWADDDNNLNGNLNVYHYALDSREGNHGGTVDLTCATEIVPAITWNAWSVTPGPSPPGDPP